MRTRQQHSWLSREWSHYLPGNTLFPAPPRHSTALGLGQPRAEETWVILCISYMQFKDNSNEYTCKTETNSGLELPWGLMYKEPACQRRRSWFHPGSGRAPGEGNGNSLQYSGLENPMDREAWQATVHGVSKSQTRLKWLSTHTRGSLVGLGLGASKSPWQLNLRDHHTIQWPRKITFHAIF